MHLLLIWVAGEISLAEPIISINDINASPVEAITIGSLFNSSTAVSIFWLILQTISGKQRPIIVAWISISFWANTGMPTISSSIKLSSGWVLKSNSSWILASWRPSGAMSAFVTTARVRSPVLSTSLDMRMDSQVVKSTVADRTFKMMDS